MKFSLPIVAALCVSSAVASSSGSCPLRASASTAEARWMRAFSPTAPPPDMVSGAFEHLLMFGEYFPLVRYLPYVRTIHEQSACNRSCR